MVIKIGQGKGITGMIKYNSDKVSQELASIIGYNKIPTGGREIGELSQAELRQPFEMLGTLKPNIKSGYLHISINPNPSDKLDDEQLATIAKDYLKQMGFASQPYVIYKHNDIERTHLHVVTTRIKPNGQLVSDSNINRRSNQIRQELETKYALIKGPVKQQPLDYAMDKIDYTASDLNQQIRTRALTAISTIKFSSFSAYQSYMKNQNISVSRVRENRDPDGKIIGTNYQAMQSFDIHKHGASWKARAEFNPLVGLPIKASSIDRSGKLHIDKLEKLFATNAVQKATDQPIFEKILTGFLARDGCNEAAGKEKGISIIINQDGSLCFLNNKSGHLYQEKELNGQTTALLAREEVRQGRPPAENGSGGNIPDRVQAGKEETNIAGGIGDIAKGAIAMIGGGDGGSGGGGSTDRSLKNKKKKRGI